MNAIEEVNSRLHTLGYQQKSIVRDYKFSDFLSKEATTQSVDLAAFTDYPFSYRNAAIGVIEAKSDQQEQVFSRRALGASIWLCITADEIQVWNVQSSNKPRCTDRRPLTEIGALFECYSDAWIPDRLHTAKLAGIWDAPEQLSLIDYSLLREIEFNIQFHLDRTIRGALQELIPKSGENSSTYSEAYRVCFYLLAAKVLQDRSHSISRHWDAADAESVLQVIQKYYQLARPASDRKVISKDSVQRSWQRLTNDISYCNISAEDLAFVYENTLVAPETRKRLGTHSTPRAVAEFLVSRLRDVIKGSETPLICEPYCGAAVLLVAALSALKSSLPSQWEPQRRHDFLVSKIKGADCDPFACQVATLSLILADYPNSNGWQITQMDLFENGALSSHLPKGSVALCNPPFEDFLPNEREVYTDLSKLSLHKPIAVLKSVLASRPAALGFVLPQGFLNDAYYRNVRVEIERYFEEIELVSLPDGVFSESMVESALLIGRHPRRSGVSVSTRLSSCDVPDEKKAEFLRGTYYPEFRSLTRSCAEEQCSGNLWIEKFSDLWEYLATNPTLGSIVKVHRGLEWKSGYQASAKSSVPKRGFRQGLGTSRGLSQFGTPHPEFIDCRRDRLRGNAISHPWGDPKVIMNAVRKSRGSWRIASCVDKHGLVLSQQLIGVWPNNEDATILHYVCAILNSPVASLFITERDPRKRFRLSSVCDIPLPTAANIDAIADISRELHALSSQIELTSPDRAERLHRKLLELDALVLYGYELPPTLERRMLLHFGRHPRRALTEFDSYPVIESGMALSLAEILQDKFSSCHEDWVADVFKPLSASESSEFTKLLP